jgi:hypothetical protein
MDDDFLYAARPGLRPEFSERLADRLRAIVNEPAQPWLARRVGRTAIAKPMLGFLRLAIVAACTAKAASLAWERRGDFWVLEAEPICEYRGWVAVGSTLSRAPEPVTVREALAMLSRPVKLPSWVPEGFAMRERVPPPAIPFSESVWVYYEPVGVSSGTANIITLWIDPKLEYDPGYIAPAEAMQTIDVRGMETLLVRGGCALPPNPAGLTGMEPGERIQTEWTDERASLAWTEEGVRYELEILGPPATAEDLIRMAESMAPVGEE